MPHYVYLIECSNGSFYTGYTTDIERRYKEHMAGSKKCKYTRSFPPVKLSAYWQFATRSDALVVEHDIKKLTKREKQKLISQWSNGGESSS